MDKTSLQKYQDLAMQYTMEFGVKIFAAIAFWVIGRILIGFTVNLVRKLLQGQKVDQTTLRYIGSIISVTLNILLVIGILGYFGMQTTTFAALLAGAGVAIGMAWSGLLAHFAAGAFLIALRPFKVGDFVCVAGINGTIREIGLFATSLDTPDGIYTTIGNNRIFGETIQNFSTNPFRRVELRAQLAASTDPARAAELLRERLAAIPNVLPTPAVQVEILEFNLVGPVLTVRPFCHHRHYWQVYFETNRIIRESFGEAGFAAPTPTQLVTVQGRLDTAPA